MVENNVEYKIEFSRISDYSIKRKKYHIEKNLKVGYRAYYPMHKTKNAFSYIKHEKKKLYLGIEYEVYIDTNKYSISNVVKDIFTKEEVSDYCNPHADSGDIEITTIPATLKTHREKAKEILFSEKYLKDVYDFKRFHTNIGVHVHIDKRDISSNTLKKLLVFTAYSKNHNFLNFIGERNKNNIVSYLTSRLNKSLTIPIEIVNSSYFRINDESLRYLPNRSNGFNIKSKYNTIEVRLFKAPTSYEKFMKNLEFCDAIVRFCEKHDQKDMTYQNFIKFINRGKVNKHKYQNLIKFISENNFN